MQLNGTSYIDRGNRPDATQRVGLLTYFINNGVYQDPYEISSVSVFQLSANQSPATILDADGLVDSSASVPLMQFESSAANSEGMTLNASDYTPGVTASGVYRISEGKYITILDNTVALSGTFEGSTIANSASDTGSYIDVWTVRFSQNAPFTTLINEFTLTKNQFFTLSEPLMIKSHWTLPTKKFRMGTKQNIKVFSKMGIENKCIPEEVRNIFRTSVISSAAFQITKINENVNTLPSRVEVSGYADTSGLVEITPDNTMILNWDTNDLLTHASTLIGEMGNLRGTYEVTVKATILNEVIVGHPLYLQVY